MASFATQLFEKLWKAQFAEYTDNHDHYRFGPAKGLSAREWLGWRGRQVLRRLGFVRARSLHRPRSDALASWTELFPGMEWLYHRLADDESRRLLVDVVAYRIMGPLGARLPLNTPDYWSRMEQIEALGDPADSVPIAFMEWRLAKHDLTALGFPIQLYIRSPGVMTQYVLEQYAHQPAGLRAGAGNVVIDGGGCFGETALYFAHLTGPSGKVFTFEFVPSNLAILRTNLSLNPQLQERVEIVERALWSNSGEPLYVFDRGPASRVMSEPAADADLRTETLSIDDLVRERCLERVDLIKLDIEGAEGEAIRGAQETIRSLRPALAIALYHSPADFVTLPRLVDQLFDGYRFFIRHLTIHSEETIFYATR